MVVIGQDYMMLSTALVLLMLNTVMCDNRLLSFKTPDEYLNICMDGISHKLTPGPEAKLFDQCSPWKDRSCCTETISHHMHVNETWYKMNWSHCNTGLSNKCRGRFVQDLCFYECSPNVGPWLVKVDGMKIRKERFVDVPLCRTECDAWWEDCKDDYTCVDNWSRGFDWSKGTPACPSGSKCRTFTETFKNASTFCEQVWDYSWKVVDDSDPNGCFVMWWNEGTNNPNDQIAKDRATQIVSNAVRIISHFKWCLTGFVTSVFLKFVF